MKKFVLSVALIVPIIIFAQNYNVNLIPDSLTKNANVVKREEEISIVIKDVNKAIIKHKYAVTIFNEAGDRDAFYQNDYDNLTDLTDISGTLYDQYGKKIKTVKKKDIADVSYEDGFSLMRDSRIKYHNFYYRQYPYTVEYEDEQTFNGILALPTWEPVENLGMSVQQSLYTIETPTDYKLRYKQFNYPREPTITNSKTNTYTWEVKNLKVYSYEPFHPDYHEITPSVHTAPTKFSYGGYSGQMSSWLDYGKYQAELNKGRDELPDNVKQDIHKLTDGVVDAKEKIRILYSYLQSNTRYISIQLGIGGLQPFDAKFVATKKYGDCKALSNYMHSLLKEAGINGYYTKITAGEGEKFYMPDFPSPQSNHIIICVPLVKDTMWLECTDQNMAAGYLGDFTDDRYGLMIKDDGGYLVKTPKYTVNDNTITRNIISSLDENGKLSATVKTNYTGLEQDNLFGLIKHLSKDKLLEHLKENIDLPTYDIVDFSYTEHKDIIPSIDEKITLTADNYASVSGKRLFICPNILSKSNTKLNSADVRRYDIVFDHPYKYSDTINIQIPSGYNIESMPKDVTINNQFGNYEIHFKINDDKIFCTRLYQCNERRFPPSEYVQMVKFYDDMYKADRSRIVFIKKEG